VLTDSIRRICGAKTSWLALSFALVGLLPGCGWEGDDWVEADGFRWRGLDVRGDQVAGFTPRDAGSLGIDFLNAVSVERRVENRTLADGSGVALGDVDGDGLVDVYFAAIDGPNALYRNRGDWRFDDITDGAGVALGSHRSTGVVLADLDGDGDSDLVVSALGDPTRILFNDGLGRFTDAAGGGLGSGRGGKTVAIGDIEGDGDLDLYVTNNKARIADDIFSPAERAFDRVVLEEDGRYSVAAGFEEHYRVTKEGGFVQRFELAEADEIWINEGDGTFSPGSFTEGRFLDEEGQPLSEAPRDWGLSARFHDIDGDGDADLYVCNDFESPDRIWMNNGAGVFRAIAFSAVRTTSLACMSVTFGDVNRDGWTDFFTADMRSRSGVRRRTQMQPMAAELTGPGEVDTRPQRSRNTLQVARGDGTFAEIGFFAGLAGSEWTWGSAFVDVDLDGFEDLLLATGHAWDELDGDVKERTRALLDGPNWRDERRAVPPLALENVAFRNRGDGTFEEIGATWGFSTEADIAHGLVTGDLDQDGDLDLVLSRLDAPPLFFENRGGAPRVAVSLRGDGANSRGIGAQVRLRAAGLPEQTKEIALSDGYLSSSEPIAVFAATDGPMELVIDWPGGRRSTLDDVRADRAYEVREASAQGPRSDEESVSAGPLFVDESAMLGHSHVELPFDDFARQPLLPLRLSQLGPGVAWEDLDRDGDPDLLVGTGRDGRLAYFRNDGGSLAALSIGAPRAELDQAGLLAVPGEDGPVLLVVQMNYEASTQAEAESAARVVALDADWRSRSPRARSREVVPGGLGMVGPLASADYDSDGDLDLFVGARGVPTAYPYPDSSQLWRNEGGGRFVLDTENTMAVAEAGMVSSAVFSDLDMDGDPDLILAIDWGPVRIFVNEGGRLVDETRSLGLHTATGRWNGVATGDLDEDGRPDIVATGWGTNTGRVATQQRPLLLFYSDLDRNGTVDVIEAEFDEEVRGAAPVRGLPDLARAMPAVFRGVRSFEQFSRSTVAGLLGPTVQLAERLEAAVLEHTVFLNRGNTFERVPLPGEAQWAPAFGVIVADFDGDGHEDVFLGQNLFSTDMVTPRFDGGRSLILLGDGRGGLRPVPGQESGVAVYGDVRGAASADFDLDGRLDLVVSQNGAETKLYRNVSARPGVLVVLEGPRDNPEAVGAAIRVEYADGSMGPIREVQAGSGYWSRNGSAQVMGLDGEPAAVRVSWPGGTRTRTEVNGPGRIEVSFGGGS
jgi:enediyne biosynthesis protein E4